MNGVVILTILLVACMALIYGVARWLSERIWGDILEDKL